MIHTITVDVYASWSDVAPVYRVYVDGDLLTEHTFAWPGHEAFVRENIVVDLEPGDHKLNVEQTNRYGTISPRNVVLDGVSSSLDFSTGK
jgi:hypothetical protein